MSQLYIVLKRIFSQFRQWGVEIEKFKFFQNRKSLCLEIQVVLKFGEERMKITLILFVHVILSSKWPLKKPIFDQKGGQNSKFQKIQKGTSRYFGNTCFDQIWSHSDETKLKQWPSHPKYD